MILFAEPPLQAEIKMRSSIMLSLILLLPDWTTNTSFSRMLVKILTLVSPCAGQPCRREKFSTTHICELGQLHRRRRHAQIRAYLSCERGTRAPSKDEGVAHRESVLGNVRGKRGSLGTERILRSATLNSQQGQLTNSDVTSRSQATKPMPQR